MPNGMHALIIIIIWILITAVNGANSDGDGCSFQITDRSLTTSMSYDVQVNEGNVDTDNVRRMLE